MLYLTQQPGYRQERIKILGYRTTDWDGSLNIPGFVYDDAEIFDWESDRLRYRYCCKT